MNAVRTNWNCWSKISMALKTAFVVLCGGGIGYLFSWVVSFVVYAATYNFGFVIRIQTLGITFGACMTLVAISGSKLQKRSSIFVVTFCELLLGAVAVLCSEWYFFGVGLHRKAVATVYRAGGGIDRNWRGQITAIALVGRPYSGFSGDDFALLANFPCMTSLKLWWPEVSVCEAKQIAQFKQLIALRLFGSKIDDEVIGCLHPLVKLRELTLSDTGITDQGLKVLNRFIELRLLNLASTNISDAGVMPLQLPNLTALDLSSTKVGDVGIAHLATMATYEDLRLGQTQVTDACIEVLKNQSQLRVVGLAFTQVSGPGFESLKNWSRLESLNLNKTNVTDDDLRWISTLVNLKDLQLTETAITDSGLSNCEELSQLTYILLNGTRVSADAVAKLRSKLPGCNVVKNL